MSALRGRRGEAILVLALCLLALGLRFYRLTAESLWYDEAYSVWTSAMDIASPRVLWAWQIEFPLYYWLLHGWMRLFGQGEFAVRALGAVAGGLSVIPMYLLGRTLDRRAGGMAALLLAVNPYHIWYSQEVRMYALALLFTILSLYTFWLLQRRPRPVIGAPYVLCTGLAFHLHYYIGWVVLGQNLFMLWRAWSERASGRTALWCRYRGWLLTQVAVALLALPALAVFLTKVRAYNQWGWLAERYGSPGLRSVIELLSAFTVGAGYSGPALGRYLAIVLFLGLMAWALLRRWRGEGTALLPLLGLAPLAIVFGLGQITALWVTRYLLLFLPAFLLLAALGLASLPRRSATFGLAALMVVVSVPGLLADYGRQQKEDWRGVAAYVAGQQAPEDLLVLLDGECSVPFDYYYGDGGRRLEVSRFADAASLDQAASEIDQQARDGRIWLIVSHGDSGALEQRLAAQLGLAAEPAPSFVGVRLVAYRRS